MRYYVLSTLYSMLNVNATLCYHHVTLSDVHLAFPLLSPELNSSKLCRNNSFLITILPWYWLLILFIYGNIHYYKMVVPFN